MPVARNVCVIALYDIHYKVVYLLEKQNASCKMGSSLAARLPTTVVDALILKPGENIDIQIAGARTSAVEKTPGAHELLTRLHQYRGRLPTDFKFNRIDA